MIRLDQYINFYQTNKKHFALAWCFYYALKTIKTALKPERKGKNDDD